EVHAAATVDALTGLNHPRRVQRMQRFMNRPVIVAGVAAALPGVAAKDAPLVLAVKYIDGGLLAEIGRRFDLPNLRALGDAQAGRDEHVFVATAANGDLIARFAWTPNRPGAKIVSAVLPFIIVVLAGVTALT